ncbi:MAG: hypothetical protein NZ693_02580, partial [Thermoflexales bacterium]|nr:hypothetical protein [Thermoflexales bacterium]
MLASAVVRDAERLRSCKATLVQTSDITSGALAARWYGRSDWRVDSGAFPDFVLAWEERGILGDGALVELKDSRDQSIASFNSTLPSARKRISTLTDLVRDAVDRYERCASLRPDERPDERDCFYLVRTRKSEPRECRLSLVQGTFFETLPNNELLKALWKQVLDQAEVPAELQEKLSPYLSQLERADIAQTRQIEGASVKPRLRIMSEVHSEGNPHRYAEITPRSVNLIVKLPEECADLRGDDLIRRSSGWILELFRADGVAASAKEPAHDQLVLAGELRAQLKLIRHRRNGLHPC